MKKLENSLRKTAEGARSGKLRIRLGRKSEVIPLETFNELRIISQAIQNGDTTETINEQAKMVCESMGIRCQEHGIGWVVG